MSAAWRALAIAAVVAVAAAPAGTASAAGPSLGLPALKPPPAAQVALGRKLFFDRRLSANGTLSCAMCHVPEQGFTVNETRTSVGMNGVSLRRNAPTLLNVAHVPRLFVDGRAPGLEAQALQPLVHPDEMANPSVAAVIARIGTLADYRALLRSALGAAPLTPARLAGALAAYQRSLVAAGTPFDRWYFGHEEGVLDAAAQRGFALFRELGCAGCHTVGLRQALFSDGAFHNTGVQARSEALREQPVAVTLAPGLQTTVTPQTLRRIGVDDAPDRGRHEVTGRRADLRAFRTPGLRNVALTAPYMHDGSLATLDAVLDHYEHGGTPDDPLQDPRIRPITIDARQRRALIAFLESLTSPFAATVGREEPGR